LTEDPATRHVAVIMVTARSTVEDVEHAFVLGAFDYIRKPFHARELLARVRNALQLKRQTDELRQWQIRMLHELDAAGALQRKLLTTDPFFSRTLEVRSAYQSSMSVGGDVFDILKLPNDHVCVYVGDVAGHGVGPAMIATLLKALVSEVAREYAGRGPAAMCNEIHRRFRHYVTNPEVYATLFIAVIDARGRQCITFNCGHPMPLLFDVQGEALHLFADRGGLPIGLFSEEGAVPYSADGEVQVVLPPGAALFVFTDGLFEARQAGAADSCGAENLGAVLAAVARDRARIDPARETLRRLINQGYQLAQDDCTLLVVRTIDPAALRLDRAIEPTHAQVAELAAAVATVLREEGWPEEAVGATQLLVAEHGANVVDHAEVPPGSRIGLQFRLEAGAAWLLFCDEGREWDFQERLAFSLRQPDDSDRGRGLRIIRAIAKHIDVVRRNRENAILYVVDRAFAVGSPTGESRG
jgi:serine phosphatase RsbU (regulator of sigma subunit)/anti-sigma regulatory factor (Ser/Thr protein kinase)